VTIIQRVSAAETLLGLRTVYQIGGIPFTRLNTRGLQPHQQRLKQIVDLLVVLLSCPVWLTVAALVACYSKVVSSSNVLYRQTRVGLHGEHFEIIKFRTMYENAEAISGPRLSERGDGRVEPKLRWLRNTRLDELPQLWNVIRGQMSLVGPRPERPEFTKNLEHQIPGYERRYSIKPGITGYAQIYGKYDSDASHKLGYDLQYLVNWSFLLDIQLLLQTAFRFREHSKGPKH
jgi:lipopolysaccharide/colanic/teichoic acid biosynthesis glycosyltransferase